MILARILTFKSISDVASLVCKQCPLNASAVGEWHYKLYSNVLCAHRPTWRARQLRAAQSKTTAADIERRDPGPSKPFGLGKPEASPSLLQRLVSPVKTIAVRTAVYASFFAAKQPSRIRSVLKQV